MASSAGVIPGRDLNAYLINYPQEIAFGDEDAGTVFDRYHTPDFIMYNDGVRLDRERLLTHVRPARKNASSVRVEVHEAVFDHDRAAARYTLTAVMRKGHVLATEIYMFGRFAADGRLQRVDQITRTLPADDD